ncbi:tyrosine-type recombinase/integrase [Bacillus sp. N1-1]|uniref:site-specific integrase n=1 Tax=Bacillus sp. N1-1 TaxID=2682541 RepID=UPI0013187F19|nr:tyrosine-type recombinase/integrase [Bacillus sp. N1-1]QHA92255.1 tyrosine-type recombinase/integrase [Bacillus sp. N1-1]
MNGSISKNKKTGKYDFIFDAGKDPLSGKRKQIKRRGFESKRAAMNEMTRLKAQVLENDFLDLNHLTYEKYMDEWFQERKFKLQHSTFEIHSIFYRNVIKPKLGHLKLQQVTPLQLQKFVNDLVNHSSYSAHTIHLVFRIVSSSFKKAEILKLIKNDPSIGITLPKTKQREFTVWSIEQVNFFISEAPKIARLTRYYIAFLIAIFTGMRQGEILGLRWKDINFETHTLYIRQTVTQNGEIKAGAKNEASVRSIHIPSKLADELKAIRALISIEKRLSGDKYQENDLVVCTLDGKPVIARNFRKEFYKVVEKVNLPRIRFHDLRHTHATILIQQNVNVKLISERLGHADIQTTLNTYSHVLPNMQKTVSDQLDKIIGV